MKVVDKDGKRYVFDVIRKKYLLLTPEEAVRQQVIQWMMQAVGYPKAAISVEKAIAGSRRRYDMVIYKNSRPWMIVECKAPGVGVDQKVFDQIGHYNHLLKVPYLYVTNGEQHFILEIDFESGQYTFLKDMPDYVSEQG